MFRQALAAGKLARALCDRHCDDGDVSPSAAQGSAYNGGFVPKVL